MLLSLVAERISDCLVTKNVVQSEYREVYTYGLSLILSTAFSIFTVLILAILLNNILSGILFVSIMMMIRFFCGGYHCKTYFSCWLCTNMIACAVFLAIRFLPKSSIYVNLAMCVVTLLCAVFIFVFSPIENSNNPLSKAKRKKNMIISRAITVCVAVLNFAGIVIFASSENTMYFMSVTSAMAVVAILMLIEIIKRRCNNEHT